MTPRIYHLLLSAFLALIFSAPLLAQNQQGDQGPMAPPPKFDVKRITAEPHPGPPPLPEAEILQRMAANEDLMKKEYNSYNFTQTIRIEELDNPAGHFTVTGEVSTKPTGERSFKTVKQPESDLKQTHFTLADVRTIASFPLFNLTSDELQHYNFKFAGQEKLDEINTYIFQVKPKLLSRKNWYFEGVVWLEDRDYAIVKSYGRFVSEIEGNGTKLPFTYFETFRENFQEKYWLPTYTRSDETIPQGDGNELRLHLVIRDTNFQLNGAPAPSAAAPSPPAPAAPPAAPSNTPKSN
jgi:hypothetical protein